MATGFGGGTGTEADPYLITNASELAHLMKCAQKYGTFYSVYEGCYFLQTTDIDLQCHNGVKGDYAPDSTIIGYDQDFAQYLEDGDSWSEYNSEDDISTVYTVLAVKDWYDSEDWVDDDSYDDGGYWEYNTHTVVDVQIDVYESQLWKPLELNAYYDGGGHTIANLIFDHNAGGGVATERAFWYRMNVGYIKNLTLQTIRNHSVGEYANTEYGAGLLYSGEQNVTIENCHVVDYVSKGIDSLRRGGFLAGSITGTIKDCSVRDCSGMAYAGVAGSINGTAENVITDNVTLTLSGKLDSYSVPVGGLFGNLSGTMHNCISNTNMNLSMSAYGSTYYVITIGGVVGACGSGTITQCAYYGNITYNVTSTKLELTVGGVVGDWGHVYNDSKVVSASENLFAGSINVSGYYKSCTIGGIFGEASDYTCTANGCSLINNLSNGTIIYSTNYTSQASDVGGFMGVALALGNLDNYYNNISNTTLTVTKNVTYSLDRFGGFYGNDSSTVTGDKIFVYNQSKVSFTNANINNTYGTTTDEAMKDPTTFASWTDFDTYWIIDENINYGYPMLRAHLSRAKITGFDGSGTQADPYQIKTTADLQGMQAYYNDYQLIDEYWWKLMNDIDISTDAGGLTINWCPIGYEGGALSGFNGHFDGNGKTISGLTITEQYENVGLFGRLASNATITNLNVSGTINWDQAKYVGGVVGLMEDGAILTNCSFTGTITGYLNSGNIAVVGGLAGKHSADTITGVANYDCYVYGTDNYTTFNRFSSTYAVI